MQFVINHTWGGAKCAFTSNQIHGIIKKKKKIHILSVAKI